MKNGIIIIIILIIIVILADIITQNYTKLVVEELTESLEKLEENLLKSEEKVLEESIQEIINNWKKKFKILAYYVEHDELEKVEVQLVSLKADIDQKEYSLAIEDLEVCIFILEHIKEKETLTLINIF